MITPEHIPPFFTFEVFHKNNPSFLKKWVCWTFFVCLVLFPVYIKGQLPSNNFTHYTSTEGLSQNTVYCMVQDDYGFMWLGTQRGLNRFDGNEFITLPKDSIRGNKVYAIAKDENNHLWIGTDQGVCKYDICEGTYWRPSNMDSLSSEVKHIVCGPGGQVWIGKSKGVFKLKDSIFQSILPKDSLFITDLQLDVNGQLWVATERGIYTLTRDSNELTRYTLQTENQKYDSVFVSSLSFNGDSLWAGTENGRLFLIDNNEKQSPTIKAFRKFDDEITSTYQDRKNHLWIGFRNRGVTIIDLGNPNSLPVLWKHEYGIPRTLSHNHVMNIFKDSEGGIWLGTFAGGANRYDYEKDFIHHIYRKEINGERTDNNFFWKIWKDKNQGFIWLGMKDGGIQIYNPAYKSFTQAPFSLFTYRSDDEYELIPEYEGTIFDIYQSINGILWAGTEKDGLFYYDTKSSKSFKQHLAKLGSKGNGIRIIKELADSTALLLGTQKEGLFYYDYHLGVLNHDKALSREYPHLSIFSILTDPYQDSIIWIGSEASGLIKKNYVTNKSEVFTFDNSEIFSIKQNPSNKDHLWIATGGLGLIKFNKHTGESEPIFGPENNMDLVYDLIIDSVGVLWMSGLNGLARYNPRNSTFDQFGYKHGLDRLEFNLGSSLLIDDKIFFGQGNNGMAVFSPEQYQRSSVNQSKAYLTNVEFGEVSLVNKNSYNRNLICSDTIYTHFGTRSVRLSLSLPEFSDHERVSYYAQVSTHSGEILKHDFFLPNQEIGISYRTRDGFFKEELRYAIEISPHQPGSINSSEPIKTLEVIAETPWWLKSLTILGAGGLAIMGIMGIFILGRYRNQKIVIKALDQRVNEKTEELRQQTQKLQSRNKRLDLLHQKINAVSRQENLDGVCELAMQDMIEFFGFDYASLSIIDPLKRRIIVSYNRKNLYSIVDPRDWQAEENKYRFDLSDPDILPFVVREEKIIKVDGNRIHILNDNNTIETRLVEIGKDLILNPEVYNDHDHGNLVRAFIPMKRRALHPKGTGDYPIGVFEVGFHRTSNYRITDQALVDLRLYIDNCAQPYHRASLEEESITIKTDLKKLAQHQDPREFLKKALEHLAKMVDADKGDFSFIPLGGKEDWLPQDPIVYGMTLKQIHEVRKTNLNKDHSKMGIYRYVVKTGKSYWTDNTEKDPFYIPGLKNVNSQISIPLVYQKKTIGALNLYSPEFDFFDKFKERVLKRCLDRVTGFYVKKKVEYTTQNLVKPLNVFSDLAIYEPIVNTIKNYFHSAYVCVWELGVKKGNLDYTLKYSSEKLRSLFKDQYLFTLSKSAISDRKEITELSYEEIKKTHPSLKKIMKEDNLSSVIFVPISVENTQIGFINIFSNTTGLQLLPEDRIFLNLISQKAGMALQMARIIQSLVSLSQTEVASDLNSFLQNLPQQAAILLQADPVVLFRYTEGEPIRYKDGFYAGEFVDNKIKSHYRGNTPFSDAKVEFANIILKKGTQWFNNKKTYLDFLDNHVDARKSFKEDFWNRENIQSSAAIRLEFEGKLLGVMFFNYRKKRDFSLDDRRFIEAFSFLATIAIVGAKNVNVVKEEKKLAQDEADKFADAYYTLARGINHDIRNNLISIGLLEDEIEDTIYPSLSKKQRQIFANKFENINFNADRIENLLKNFEFEKRFDEWIDVKQVIEQNIRFFNKKGKIVHQPKIEFIREYHEPIPDIYGDSQVLSMIIYNLVSNAVKAIEKQENSNYSGYIKVVNLSKDDKFQLMIEDNGIGIDNEIGDLIFEPHFSKDQKGIGYGLHFVKEALGKYFSGEIDYQSKYGKGTRFSIRIALT